MVETYAARIRDVFDAAGAAPPASRLGHATGEEDAYFPPTLDRYLDRRALDLAAGVATNEGDGLPFYPPPDLTNVFGPEAYWLGRIRRRYQLWGDRWREVKTCPVCWDALPEAETTGGSLGRSEEKDLRLCSHVKDVCVECVRSFCRAQLGDVAKITGEGLPCVESTCSAPLTLAALGASYSWRREHGDGSTYMSQDRLLTTDECAKARRFIRAAKVHSTKGAACWCPNGCDELVDLTSATPQCRVCAVEVCKTCQQKKHSGDCAKAATSADEALWRENWQRCPGCKAINGVEIEHYFTCRGDG